MRLTLSFIDPSCAPFIERIRRDDTIFNIGISYLEVVVSEDETFRFYIDNIIVHEDNVQYDNGVIEFVREEDYVIVAGPEECPVCLETYTNSYGSTCGHSVCVPCLKRMNENNLSTCPMCRSELFAFPVAKARIRVSDTPRTRVPSI